MDFGVSFRCIAACVPVDYWQWMISWERAGAWRHTGCSSRVFWRELGQVVYIIINNEPCVVGKVVFGDFLDGDDSRHDDAASDGGFLLPE